MGIFGDIILLPLCWPVSQLSDQETLCRSLDFSLVLDLQTPARLRPLKMLPVLTLGLPECPQLHVPCR